MNYLKLENEILSSVRNLNGHQKSDVLDYIKNIKPTSHNQKLYRKKGLKQIREALNGL